MLSASSCNKAVLDVAHGSTVWKKQESTTQLKVITAATVMGRGLSFDQAQLRSSTDKLLNFLPKKKCFQTLIQSRGTTVRTSADFYMEAGTLVILLKYEM